MKQQHWGEVVNAVGLAFLLAGCGSTHHLGYDTATVPAQPGPSLNAVVSVEPFEDTRRLNEPAIVFTGKDFPVTVNGTSYCLTLEEGYAGKVAEDLRSVIERHVRQRGVIAAWSSDAEKYRLDGTLAALLGQIVSPKAGIGKYLGISAIAILESESTKRDGQIDIVFQDLRLTRLRDGTTRPLPEVAVHFKGVLKGTGGGSEGVGDCQMIFDHLDQHLKPAVDELVAAVEQSVREWPTGKP
jgi:hypothetical protein